MPQLIGAFVAYKLIKQLSLDWEEWDAYKLGLIDNKGNTLKKAKTKEEKDSMDYSLRLVKNVKKLIERLPFGKTRLGTLAAAMYLLKEDLGVENNVDFDLEMKKYINIDDTIIIEGTPSEYLINGKYVNIDTDQMYYISEFEEPVSIEMGIPLYKLTDLKTKEQHIVSQYDIRRI